MTTYEIYQFINKLEPENKVQAKLIKKLLRVIERETETKQKDRTQLYIDELKADAVVGKEVGVVYAEYCEWCKKFYYTPLGRSIFSRRVCDCLNIKSKVAKINGESKRVYY